MNTKQQALDRYLIQLHTKRSRLEFNIDDQRTALSMMEEELNELYLDIATIEQLMIDAAS